MTLATADIPCPKCQARLNRVTDSRGWKDAIRRRRLCTKCGARFTTYETTEGVASRIQMSKVTGLLRMTREMIDRYLEYQEEGSGPPSKGPDP